MIVETRGVGIRDLDKSQDFASCKVSLLCLEGIIKILVLATDTVAGGRLYNLL